MKGEDKSMTFTYLPDSFVGDEFAVGKTERFEPRTAGGEDGNGRVRDGNALLDRHKNVFSTREKVFRKPRGITTWAKRFQDT